MNKLTDEIKDFITYLFDENDMVLDLVTEFEIAVRKIYQKHGFPPTGDGQWEKWYDESGLMKLEDKCKDDIHDAAKEFILKNI